MSQSKNLSYKDSGVDIIAGEALISKIKPLAAATKRTGVMSGLGGFGALFDLQKTGYNDPILVSATDGVGTKLKLAIDSGINGSVGIDLVAMCVNDLIVQGAEPLFFLDYFATGKLDISHANAVIEGIAKGCELAGCALIGGETAEMPNMYKDKDYDLAGFAVGAVERENILPNNVKNGDILIGITSSGMHSNGFSLVRKILEIEGLNVNDKAPFADGTIAENFLIPTKIYVRECMSAIKTGGVKALAHITGGGLTENIPRILPDSLSAKIDITAWEMPDIFKYLMKVGNIKLEEMLKTFNCGIGMVLVVDADSVEIVMSELESESYIIGRISDE